MRYHVPVVAQLHLAGIAARCALHAAYKLPAAGGVAHLVALIHHGIPRSAVHIEADARAELPQLAPQVLEAEELHGILVAERAVVVEHRAAAVAQRAGLAHHHVAASLPRGALEASPDDGLRVEVAVARLVEGVDETVELVVGQPPLRAQLLGAAPEVAHRLRVRRAYVGPRVSDAAAVHIHLVRPHEAGRTEGLAAVDGGHAAKLHRLSRGLEVAGGQLYHRLKLACVRDGGAVYEAAPVGVELGLVGLAVHHAQAVASHVGQIGLHGHALLDYVEGHRARLLQRVGGHCKVFARSR